MRASLVLLLGVAVAVSLEAASPLTFYLSNANGTTGAALPNTYPFGSTAEASASSVILKVINTSTNTVDFPSVIVTTSISSTAQSPDFTVKGFFSSGTLAPGDSRLFTVNFAPTESGAIIGYLQFVYAVDPGGPSTIATASILTGTATPPQLVLSYSTSAGSVVPQPDSTPIQFANVPDCGSSAITFTVQNQTAYPAPAPVVSINTLQFINSPFSLDKSTLASTIGANSSSTFTVTLAPGNPGVYNTNLVVGSNSYPLQGNSTDPLTIKYVDTTGVGQLAQTATPIVFGNVLAGVNGSSVLNFSVTNPVTSTGPVTLAVPSVSGNGFAISGVSAATTLQPGDQPLTFTLTFAENAPGTYTGTLSIGCLQFTLSGQSVASPLLPPQPTSPQPTFTFQLNPPPPLTSQQQVDLSIKLDNPSAINAPGLLKMQFTPSVANVTDDPTIFLFTTPSDRTIDINVAAGSQTVTFTDPSSTDPSGKDQSSLTFQTGTTAGTISFTVAGFPNTEPYTQSFTIAKAPIQITFGQAVRQDPNLLITLNGYDNTYSAGALSFIFYDLKGNAITTIPVDATSNFHQYFFTNDQDGGAFVLRANFVVTGDVTQIGSVAATLTNSIGQTSTTQTFQ
ncbi:MAG TPA: choice-of-anchor D domain-containing protein [Bryobacteraceae bacterium]|jgi:hypothetical protein